MGIMRNFHIGNSLHEGGGNEAFASQEDEVGFHWANGHLDRHPRGRFFISAPYLLCSEDKYLLKIEFSASLWPEWMNAHAQCLELALKSFHRHPPRSKLLFKRTSIYGRFHLFMLYLRDIFLLIWIKFLSSFAHCTEMKPNANFGIGLCTLTCKNISASY